MSEMFDLHLFHPAKPNSREYVMSICDCFFSMNYYYDDNGPLGYAPDSTNEWVKGTYVEAINALSKEQGQINLHSNVYSIPGETSEKTIINYPFTITVFMRPMSKDPDVPGYFWISISPSYGLNGYLLPQFVSEIEKMSKVLFQRFNPLYGCGGKEYWVDYFPKLSEITTSFGVPDIFPINYFGKQLVNHIGEERILHCEADIIHRFSDGSYMIWPSRDPYWGDIKKIKRIKQIFGIKEKSQPR
jgi:hypothetical protein